MPFVSLERGNGHDRIVEHVTCLGCGCACDDIEVHVAGERIVEARRACPLGIAWFGDGAAPARARVRGRDVAVDDALDAAARLLMDAEHPLVYLAPELSCEAQREGVAIADFLHASLDSVTSSTVIASVLASQERGRASATLGEVRNRGDVVVFWGVDPGARYPRFAARYAPEPAGTHLPEGRRSRLVVAVDVAAPEGAEHGSPGPADADLRLTVSPGAEPAALVALAALVASAGGKLVGAPGGDGESWKFARTLAPILLAARYAVIVHDAEPAAGRPPVRADAMIALAQALNGPTRCALSTLRAGGNRSGADSVMTSQTGFPVAVDFSRGAPAYRPYDGTVAACLAISERRRMGSAPVVPHTDAVLLLGDAARVPSVLIEAMARVPCAIIGPRASGSDLAQAAAVIDSAVAGIHEGGTALRMDDVPLPLRPSVPGPPGAEFLIRQLCERLVTLATRSGASLSSHVPVR